jgi:ribosomal protein S18 acetylase RimI-like enzyme
MLAGAFVASEIVPHVSRERQSILGSGRAPSQPFIKSQPCSANGGLLSFLGFTVDLVNERKVAVERVKFGIARTGEAAAIAAILAAAGAHLTAQYGRGGWSRNPTEKGVLFHMRHGTVYVARKRNRPIATLVLVTKKPWAIDRSYFSPAKRPLYLIGMAVAPAEQRRGIGRLCIEGARTAAKKRPADAIFLDAFDAKAGAGEFYRKCGFREVGRVAYKGCPLIYFEMLLKSDE